MRRKNIRERGKLQLSRYFQDLKKGDSVAVVRERSVRAVFPQRLQGKTGVVEGKKGRVFGVLVKDQNKLKKFFIEPIHLKKINQIKG